MRLIAILLAASLTPTMAFSDTCRSEIEALFDGPLDPFQRPPHRQIVQMLDAEGNQTREMLNLFETPMRTIAGEPAANWFTMAIDQEIWNGPSIDGPWQPNAAKMPADRDEAMARAHRELRENLTDTVCHGANDKGDLVYTYRSKTNPDENGTFFGALETVTLSSETGQIILFDKTEFENPWTEGRSTERHIISLEYDPDLQVSHP